MDPVRILLVSGSLREGSTNSALVRTAAALAPDGVEASIYEGLGELPHFNPDDDAEGVEVPAPVAALRSQLRGSDAALFSAPEYAGALPGSFKNLLEWTVGGSEIYRLPAGWVNVAPAGRGLDAEESLRKVLGYVGADLAEEACVRLAMDRAAISSDGTVGDPEYRARVAEVLDALAAHVRGRRADPEWTGPPSSLG
jgi:chromate reductase